VQFLKELGLRLQDHAVVVPSEVQVMVNMTLDPVAVAFSPTDLVNHVFPHAMIALLKWNMECLVFFLTLFLGKWVNTDILLSLLTPVLLHLLTPCLSIDVGRSPGEHMAC
jgi:hypothetical protein